MFQQTHLPPVGLVQYPTFRGDIATTQSEVEILRRWHLASFYEDSEGYQVAVNVGRLGRAIDISHESGKAIKAAMMADSAVDDSDTYDEDPTARIYYLKLNNYGRLLTSDEHGQMTKAMGEMQWQLNEEQRQNKRLSRNHRYGKKWGGR